MKNCNLHIRAYLLLLLLVPGSAAFTQKGKPLSEGDRIRFDAAFINGNKEKMLNNPDEAIKQFKTCLTLQPDNAAVNYVMSQIYLDKQLYEDAEMYAKRTVNFDDKNTWYKKQLADVYKQRKKYEEAAPLYMEIGLADKDVNMEIEAAYMYVLGKNYNKAIKTLDKVESQIGITEEVCRQKEQIYLAQNKLKKAIGEIEKLIKTYPEELKYKGMLADLYMANNNTDQAVKLYEEVLKLDSDNGLAHFALADYWRSKGDKEKYYSSVKAGMASKSMDIKSKLNAMVSFMALKTFDDQSAKNFELARTFVAANPTEGTAYMVLGDLYNQDKNYESAREEYLKAVALEPATYMAWQQIVFCSSELRNNDYLKKDCERALEYFPNEAAFYVYLSVACMQLKEYEKASETARKGLDVASEQKEIQLQLYSTLGDASHYLKKYSTCDSAYEEALKPDPANAYALNNYAYFLSLRNIQLDKAETMSKKSLEIDPGNSSYMDTYGWILYQKKDYAKAKEYIEKSLAATPNSGEVVEHLADIQFQMGQKEDALKNWKKAKELGSSGELLDKKINDGRLYE